MKAILLYISLGLLLLLTACEKESIESTISNKSLLQLMQVDGEYFARDVLEFPDGSLILSAISENTAPAVLAYYTNYGNILWQIELPETTHSLWHTILLANGNIAVVGFGSVNDADECGIVILSQNGEVLNQTNFFNYSGATNAVDCIQLSNGNLALLTNGGRLVIFDTQLNMLFDNSYGGGSQHYIASILATSYFLYVSILREAGNFNLLRVLIKAIRHRYNNGWPNKIFFLVTRFECS